MVVEAAILLCVSLESKRHLSFMNTQKPEGLRVLDSAGGVFPLVLTIVCFTKCAVRVGELNS
jgi:hypothetical protein